MKLYLINIHLLQFEMWLRRSSRIVFLFVFPSSESNSFMRIMEIREFINFNQIKFSTIFLSSGFIDAVVKMFSQSMCVCVCWRAIQSLRHEDNISQLIAI